MLSWLFPKLCRLCGEPCADAALCAACAASLERLERPICLYCGAPLREPLEDPYHCPECSGKARPFSFARSCLFRTEHSMRLVHDFKYHSASYLAPAFARILDEAWEENVALQEWADWQLVPVPVTPRRLYSRGYNQSELLVRALARLRSLSWLDPLERRETGARSQTALSAEARQRNALLAYRAKAAYASGARSVGRHLLLVDDVFTTGSTARACARALAALPGKPEVAVLTLLRISGGSSS